MTEEKYTWQFRDQKIPAHVWYLLRDKEIGRTDLLIGTLVDTLVKPQGKGEGEEGRGCYATNTYFSRAVGVHEMNVSKSISKMKRLKMMLVFTWGDRRYMEMVWSRTPSELLAVMGNYGKALRKAHRNMFHKDIQEKGGKRNHLGGVNENANGGVKRNSLPELESNNRNGRKLEELPFGQAAHAAPRGGRDVFNSARSTPQEVPEGFADVSTKKKPPTWCSETAGSFYRALERKGLTPIAEKDRYVIQRWAPAFARAETMWVGTKLPDGRRRTVPEARKEVEANLNFYLENCGNRKYMSKIKKAWDVANKQEELHDQRLRFEQEQTKAPLSLKDISPEAQALVKEIEKFDWSRDVKEQLPGVVQASLTFYKAFHSKCQKVLVARKKDHKFCNDLIEGLVVLILKNTPATCVRDWFDRQCRNTQKRKWADWSGRVWAVTADDKQFTKDGQDLADSYHTTSLWNDLLSTIEKLKGKEQ